PDIVRDERKRQISRFFNRLHMPLLTLIASVALTGVATNRANAQSTTIDYPVGTYNAYIQYPFAFIAGQSTHSMTYINNTNQWQTMIYRFQMARTGTVTVNANGGSIQTTDPGSQPLIGTDSNQVMPGRPWSKTVYRSLTAYPFAFGFYTAVGYTTLYANGATVSTTTGNSLWDVLPYPF
ncbi:MAG: hypothetical protein NT023_07235, partial [Armatimonadetes bacterium]|nr:hypothetical protein [Armatimonadota bacterium]